MDPVLYVLLESGPASPSAYLTSIEQTIFLLMGGPVAPVVVPTSLQNAIKLDWYGVSGFSTTIGPLHFDQPPAGTVAPYVVMSHPMELPGETLDDAVTEIAFFFYAGSAATTRRLGRLFIAWVSRLETVISNRERYWWETGLELGNLIDSSAPIKVPKRFTDGADLFRYTVLVRFLIDGRP